MERKKHLGLEVCHPCINKDMIAPCDLVGTVELERLIWLQSCLVLKGLPWLRAAGERCSEPFELVMH